jgi:tetratricopeptide (TPR) repeat protein
MNMAIRKYSEIQCCRKAEPTPRSRMFRVMAALLPLALPLVLHAASPACKLPPDVSPTPQPPSDAASLANAGNWYAAHQQTDCAIEAFQSAHQLDPGSAHINYLLGLSYYMTGRMAEGEDPLEKSVLGDPSQLKPHLILAATLAALGKPRAAADQWQAALKLDPHSPMAQDGLCKALLAQGQSAPVIAALSSAHLDEILTLDLVQALEMENKLTEAARVLGPALKTWPSSHAIVYAMVTVEVRQQHPEEGAHVAEIYAKAHPHDFAAQKLYLDALEFNGDPAIAHPLAHRLLAAEPHDPELLYLAGMDDCLIGQYQLARAHLEEAIARDPVRYGNSYNARYYLGTALFELNDFAGAKEQLEKALAAPSAGYGEQKPQARFELAMALRNLGQAAEARDQMKLYQQEKDALDDRTLAAQKTITADDEMQRGDPLKAAERYQEALHAAPGNANLSYKLALALDSAGNFTDERTALEQAIAIDPTFALAHYQLGYVDSQQGDLAGAEQEFRLAVHDAPGYTKAWISLAATLGMESKMTEARQASARALELAPRNPEASALEKELAQGRAHP